MLIRAYNQKTGQAVFSSFKVTYFVVGNFYVKMKSYLLKAYMRFESNSVYRGTQF